MQELMNSIIHQWSHSWYRSRYCPLSIVQDGGDTAINGTVPIYFQASPNLCHHVGRGINPHGRAITPTHTACRHPPTHTAHTRCPPMLAAHPCSPPTHARRPPMLSAHPCSP